MMQLLAYKRMSLFFLIASYFLKLDNVWALFQTLLQNNDSKSCNLIITMISKFPNLVNLNFFT